jgi:trk system potassium uptake protein TrkH
MSLFKSKGGVRSARALFSTLKHFTRSLWLRWHRLRPAQQLTLGFLSYVVIGVTLLSLPMSQAQPVAFLDNLFGVTSAMSTTGLVTVSTGPSYTFFGELVHLLLFQLGGIGYMTVSSFIILAYGRSLGRVRTGVLSAGFTLPHYFRIDRFVLQVVIFTFLIESVGAAVLYAEFRAAGMPDALWSAVFHSVSAFATAGFGLYPNSLEDFKHNVPVNLTISALCYAGSIGFIVLQDFWYSIYYRERMITFTSKVILVLSGMVLLVGTPIFYFVEPSIRDYGTFERLMASAFQVMTASTTAGFNTIPIGPLSLAALWLIVIAMLIGASPSGTGGGIKTTTVSALAAAVMSLIRGRSTITLLGNEIPTQRLLAASAAASFYLFLVALGVLALSITEQQEFIEILFEVTSAIGTVGLSMGITGELSDAGKWVIIALMFAGRVGPLTLGLALFSRRTGSAPKQADDLAT